MLAEIAIVISILSLVVSGIQYYSSREQFKKTTGVAIKHEMSSLPPYQSKEDLTKIIVRNEGNITAMIARTFLTFTWDDELYIELYYDEEKYEYIELSPNEEETFYERLPSPEESGTHFVMIITVFQDGKEKYGEFPFHIKKGFVVTT
jgi:hypothetical protein